MTQQSEHQEAAQAQTDSRVTATGHEVGLRSQARSVMERKQNPQFYDKFVGSSLEDSEKWGHLFNEFAPWMADDHVLANRRDVYRRKRELLNRVRATQAVVGASPGARLREKPLANALSQGVNVHLDEPIPLSAAGQSTLQISEEGYTEPMSAEEIAAMEDIAEISTARQSMGVGQAGSEALTTATTEQRTVRNDEREESGAATRISEAISR